jgi:acyl carrier protein
MFMEQEKFIQLFAEQFDDIDSSKCTIDTRFRDIESWSSLTALSIIAMVDEEFNVSLKGDDIRNSMTIQDIYNIVKSKL